MITGCGQQPGHVSTAGTSPTSAGTTSGQNPTTTDPTSTGTASTSTDPGSDQTAGSDPSKKTSPETTPSKKQPSGPPMLLDSIVPTDKSTVGVAMPIVIIFSTPVKKSARADIERAAKVTTSIPVTGAWHWFGDRQVEFRPKEYWPSGDEVTLRAEFDQVGDGYGRYGTHAYVRHFTIGGDFETKISVPHHTTKVYRDGKLIKTMPSDAGSPEFPSWEGTMAVVGTVRNQHMTSCSAGITCNKHNPNYYDGWYPWAVRLTYSGTFVHYSDADPQPGHGNGSHGCVHLSWDDAKWYFRHISVGDPVTITGSGRGKASADNGYAAYNLSWSQWQHDSGLGAVTTNQS
ncbi:L,D-transpeptidase family protein [Microlunatus elymi]|uniref:L,D-transpeptidase family protein n=2 Tax=Microlunatus elymi TaxID=2596828 RepID=A0A516Q541_9ACTN|nr:L,D-transpeptidase family protein [Microlunatus elymi]